MTIFCSAHIITLSDSSQIKALLMQAYCFLLFHASLVFVPTSLASSLDVVIPPSKCCRLKNQYITVSALEDAGIDMIQMCHT